MTEYTSMASEDGDDENDVDLEPSNDEDIADDDDGVRQAGTKKPKENSNTLPT